MRVDCKAAAILNEPSGFLKTLTGDMSIENLLCTSLKECRFILIELDLKLLLCTFLLVHHTTPILVVTLGDPSHPEHLKR
jgi:hypothetical protein